jgi:sulfonate transport system permease protein
MNFSRWQRLRWLVIPASLPGWFTGLRLALSQAWVSLIVVELLASSEGIGYLMVWGRQLFQLDIVFVTIAVVGLSGLLMEWAANRVYARLVFWPQPYRTAGLEAAGQLACIPAAADPAGAVAAGQPWGWIDSTLFSSPLAVGSALWPERSAGSCLLRCWPVWDGPLPAARWGSRLGCCADCCWPCARAPGRY